MWLRYRTWWNQQDIRLTIEGHLRTPSGIILQFRAMSSLVSGQRTSQLTLDEALPQTTNRVVSIPLESVLQRQRQVVCCSVKDKLCLAVSNTSCVLQCQKHVVLPSIWWMIKLCLPFYLFNLLIPSFFPIHHPYPMSGLQYIKLLFQTWYFKGKMKTFYYL